MPNVLALLPEGFEEIEAVTPIDLWRRGGVAVTTAALSDAPSAAERALVTGRSQLGVAADTVLAAVPEEAVFDAIFLPGGPGVKLLRADPRVAARVRAQSARGGWLFAICAAPTVLHDAGLLHGRRYTAHFSVAQELPDLLADEAVVVDGRIITSRGAGTALPFALETLRRLVGADAAAKVAASICA